jgi:hypothetical protein
MTLTVLLLAVTYLISSCQWSPERDNPFDPYSVGYRAPPPQNRSPQIDTFFATTHCFNNSSDPVCEYELVCQISDSDGNLGIDPKIPVYFEDDSLGLMYSDPVRQAFVFRGYRSDLPDRASWTFLVKVADDSGAMADKQTSFDDWANDHYPTLVFPPDPRWPPYKLVNPVPRLSWLPTNPGGGAYFEVTIYLRGLHKVWDSVGIAILDTAVEVTHELQDASSYPEAWYAWFLTEFDTDGNSSTSIPGWFYFLPPDSIDQPVREEPHDH